MTAHTSGEACQCPQCSVIRNLGNAILSTVNDEGEHIDPAMQVCALVAVIGTLSYVHANHNLLTLAIGRSADTLEKLLELRTPSLVPGHHLQ